MKASCSCDDEWHGIRAEDFFDTPIEKAEVQAQNLRARLKILVSNAQRLAEDAERLCARIEHL